MTQNYQSALFETILKNYSKVQEIGLHNGRAGLLLALMYSHQEAEDISRVSSAINSLASSLITHLNKGLENPLFSTGICGVLWTLHKLKQDNLIEIESKTFTSYAPVLNDILLHFARQNSFDNLHGAFGILKYLVDSETLKTKSIPFFTKLFKDAFYKNGCLTLQKEMYAFGIDDKAYNFGFAHGISGKLTILLKAFEQTGHKEFELIIHDIAAFLKQTINHQSLNNNVAFFPSLAADLSNINYGKKRLAWCYGDLGCSLALYKYSRVFNIPVMEQQAIALLLNLAERRGLKENYILDTPFCHGTTGLSYIFNKLFKKTNNTVFKKSSDYWDKKTVDFFQESNDSSGFGFYSIGDKKKEVRLSLLEGTAGIILTTFAKKNNCYGWDGCLFLD